MCDSQTAKQPRQLSKTDDNFNKLMTDFVKQNPLLYNGQKTEPTSVMWEPFATQHNISVKECRKLWKNARDRYVKRCRRILKDGASPYDDKHSLSFLRDIVFNNLMKTNAKTPSTKKCTKRKEFIDATSVTANMLKQSLKQKKKEETLQRYNQEIFQKETESINDVIPVVFCSDKDISTQIEDKTVTFKLSTMNVLNEPEEECVETNHKFDKSTTQGKKRPPVHQSTFQEKDECIDATVATANMLVKIMEKRKMEQNLPASKPYNHTILNQVTPFQIHTNQETIIPTQKNIITFKVLNKTNKGTVAPKICVSTVETTLNFNALSMGSPDIDNQKLNLMRTKYSNLNDDNTMTTQNIPNIEKSYLEKQYTEIEDEVKQSSQNKSQIVESSKDSTERNFDEMGEYVYKNFPQDKQLKLKKKIWSLVMQID